MLVKKVFLALAVICFLSSFVAAGPGLKWTVESSMVESGTAECMTYSVYNPWPEDSTVALSVSEELEEVLTKQESESKFVPANTPSGSAIPIEFCFKVPDVYEEYRDCWVGPFVCEQSCPADIALYEGEVLASEVAGEGGGATGSATTMAVSAPLRLRVQCSPYERDYRLFYFVAAAVAVIGFVLVLYKKRMKAKQLDGGKKN